MMSEPMPEFLQRPPELTNDSKPFQLVVALVHGHITSTEYDEQKGLK